MPFVHAQIYFVTLFPAFLLGVLIAWGVGTGLVSRVLPVVACMGVTWLVVSEWVKHVDASENQFQGNLAAAFQQMLEVGWSVMAYPEPTASRH